MSQRCSGVSVNQLNSRQFQGPGLFYPTFILVVNIWLLISFAVLSLPLLPRQDQDNSVGVHRC